MYRIVDICIENLNNSMFEQAQVLPVNHFGLWVKDKREAIGWSVRKLADEAQKAAGEKKVCSPGYISQLENNTYVGKKGNPMQADDFIVVHLARALGEDPEEALRISKNLQTYTPTYKEVRVEQLFSLSTAVYNSLVYDAKRCKRSVEDQVEAILVSYLETEDTAINSFAIKRAQADTNFKPAINLSSTEDSAHEEFLRETSDDERENLKILKELENERD